MGSKWRQKRQVRRRAAMIKVQRRAQGDPRDRQGAPVPRRLPRTLRRPSTEGKRRRCYRRRSRRQSSAKLERRGVYKVSPGPPIRASGPEGGSSRSSTGARADSMLAVVVCRKVLFLSVVPMRNGGGHAVDVGDNDRASAHKHESVKLRVCACVLKKACTGSGPCTGRGARPVRNSLSESLSLDPTLWIVPNKALSLSFSLCFKAASKFARPVPQSRLLIT